MAAMPNSVPSATSFGLQDDDLAGHRDQRHNEHRFEVDHPVHDADFHRVQQLDSDQHQQELAEQLQQVVLASRLVASREGRLGA